MSPAQHDSEWLQRKQRELYEAVARHIDSDALAYRQQARECEEKAAELDRLAQELRHG